MPDKYHAFYVKANEDIQAIVIALLYESDFEAIVQEEDQVIFYVGESSKSSFGQLLKETADKLNLETSNTELPNINWNAEWEANFSPIIIDDFCQIHADFHEVDHSVKYNIRINPKMAFGTGHHETTHMVIRHMSSMTLNNKRILDFGCGTSVLAILAEKMGANSIDAIDYDVNSVENSIENARINNCSNIDVYHGDKNAIPRVTYDLILANINRSVLLDCGEDLRLACKPSGDLIISGFLNTEVKMLRDHYESYGFLEVSHTIKGEWCAMHLKRQ